MSNSGGQVLRRALAWRGTTVFATLAVVALGGVVAARTVDLGELVAAVRAADLRLLVVSGGVYALSWPLRGQRYDDILGSMSGRCGRGFLTGVVFLSQTANLVVPARAGDGIRAYLLKRRRGVSYATGGASLAVERLFDLLALAAFGTLAVAWLVLRGHRFGSGRTATFVAAAAAVAAVAVLASAVVVALARSDRTFGSALQSRIDRQRLSAAMAGLVRFGADVRVVAANPHALGRIGVGSLAIWALDVLTAVVVLAALVEGIALSTLLAVGTLAVTVGNLAKVLPLSQGGIGFYEAAFTALVVAVSPIGPAVALAAAVLDHGLKNAVTLLGGAVSALGLNVSPTVTSRGGEPAEAESPDF